MEKEEVACEPQQNLMHFIWKCQSTAETFLALAGLGQKPSSSVCAISAATRGATLNGATGSSFERGQGVSCQLHRTLAVHHFL